MTVAEKRRTKTPVRQVVEALAVSRDEAPLDPLPADVFEALVAALAESLVIAYLADQQGHIDASVVSRRGLNRAEPAIAFASRRAVKGNG